MIPLIDVCNALFIVRLEYLNNHALVEFADEVHTTVMPVHCLLCYDLALLKENRSFMDSQEQVMGQV